MTTVKDILTRWQREDIVSLRARLDEFCDLLQDPRAQPHEFEATGSNIRYGVSGIPDPRVIPLAVLVALEAAEEGARRRCEAAYRAAGRECSLPELIDELRTLLDEIEGGSDGV